MRLDSDFNNASDYKVAENKPDTGFTENFSAGVQQMLDHQSSLSKGLNLAPYYERNAILKDLINSGRLGNNKVKSGDDYDWAGLARQAKEQGFDVKDDMEVQEEINANIAERDAYSADIIERGTTFGGTSGMISGMIAAGAVDPVVAVPAVVGPIGLARVFGAAATAMRLGVYEGVSAAAGETALQYGKVKDWEESRGIEYGHGDALLAIGTAGVLSGTITGGLKKLTSIPANRRLKRRELEVLNRNIEAVARMRDALGPNADFMDELTRLQKVEDSINGIRMTSQRAQDIIAEEVSIPAGKPIIRLKAKPKEKPEKPVEKPTEAPSPVSREAIDAQVEQAKLSPEEAKYLPQHSTGYFNALIRKKALIEAQRKVCK